MIFCARAVMRAHKRRHALKLRQVHSTALRTMQHAVEQSHVSETAQHRDAHDHGIICLHLLAT